MARPTDVMNPGQPVFDRLGDPVQLNTTDAPGDLVGPVFPAGKTTVDFIPPVGGKLALEAADGCSMYRAPFVRQRGDPGVSRFSGRWNGCLQFGFPRKLSTFMVFGLFPGSIVSELQAGAMSSTRTVCLISHPRTLSISRPASGWITNTAGCFPLSQVFKPPVNVAFRNFEFLFRSEETLGVNG